MLENLKDLIRQHAGDAIINNTAIPNDKNEEAISDASSSIIASLKGAIANGNVDGVVNLFQGGAQSVGSNPVMHNIQASYAQDLVHKFGLDQGKASQIAGTLIPIVLQKMVKKTNDPGEKSFDLQDIISNLTGGVGLQDVLGNGPGAASSDTSGGVLDKIKGMFK
jgi:hypothetical protein